MTNEEMRVAIAEAVGCTWKVLMTHDGWVNRLDHVKWSEEVRQKTNAWAGPEPINPPVQIMVPDYPGDLNAMHEAEKLLTDEQWPEYREHLRTITLGPIRLVSQWCKADIHATAAQRAEAFLRCIGKFSE